MVTKHPHNIKRKINRISISLPLQLLIEFDKSMEQAGFTDRSKAIQAALYSFIDEHTWKSKDSIGNNRSENIVGV